MLRILFSLTLFSSLVSCPLPAQESDQTATRNNFFYIGPVDLFYSTIQLSYERKLKNHNSFFLSAGYMLSKRQDFIDKTGANGEVQYKINLLYNKESVHPVVKAYSWFAYFAPFLSYKYEEITDQFSIAPGETRAVRTFVNSGFGGLGFGLRVTGIQNRLSLNIFAGGGLKFSDLNGQQQYSNFLEVGYTGITPKLELQLGIAL